MDAIYTKTIRVNKKGILVLPAKIRKLLGLDAASNEINVSLMPDGEVKLRAITRVFKSFSLEYNEDLRTEVFEAYDEVKRGEVISGDRIDELIKD
jgi:AbrB family looped-hinge helix DNA binding protein